MTKQQDIEPEIVKMLNRYFWNLLESEMEE